MIRVYTTCGQPHKTNDCVFTDSSPQSLDADVALRDVRSLGYVSVDCDPRSQCLAPPRL